VVIETLGRSFELQSRLTTQEPWTGYQTPLKGTCSGQSRHGWSEAISMGPGYEYNDILWAPGSSSIRPTMLKHHFKRWNDSASGASFRLNSAGKIEVYVDVVLKGTSTKILQDSTLYRVELHIVTASARKAPAPD